MGCCALARRRCRAAEWRREGEVGVVEREVRWRAPSRRWLAEHGRGELSRRCGEVSFFSFLERWGASG
jgi:hypothetical protein